MGYTQSRLDRFPTSITIATTLLPPPTLVHVSYVIHAPLIYLDLDIRIFLDKKNLIDGYSRVEIYLSSIRYSVRNTIRLPFKAV